MRRVASTLMLWAMLWAMIWWFGHFLFRHPEWKEEVFLPTLVGLTLGSVGFVCGEMARVARTRRRWTAMAFWLSIVLGSVVLLAGSDVVRTIAVGHGLRTGLTAILTGFVPFLVLYRRRTRTFA